MTQVSAIALCFMLACISNPAPAKWKPDTESVQTTPYGGWVIIVSQKGPYFAGELIAVDDGMLYISTPGQQELTRIPVDDIREAELYAYDAGIGGSIAWTLLGTLSTISHGYFLVFTAPSWLISGTLITRLQSQQGFYEYSHPLTPKKLSSLRSYARFPQGLPEKPKPPPAPEIPAEASP